MLINFYFQGSLERLNNHVNTKHKIKVLDKKYKLPKEVNSFHNLGILRKDLNSVFDPIAVDEENNVESFKLKNNIFGIMWHPEREKPFSSLDLKLMKNFFND